jgi:membrane AbrB-like protein
MTLSAAVHLTGVTTSRPPTELIVAAQVVVGSAIGARFAGMPARRVLRGLLLALGASLILLAITAGFSLGLGAATGLPLPALFLGYAPGGVAEMSLIALALGAEAAFVSTHHVARIFMVVVAAPLAYRLLRLKPPPSS